jgi:hypothetical protein
MVNVARKEQRAFRVFSLRHDRPGIRPSEVPWDASRHTRYDCIVQLVGRAEQREPRRMCLNTSHAAQIATLSAPYNAAHHRLGGHEIRKTV